MGDSRSWAAEKEDEITVCRHGAESLYFDRCTCDGCSVDAEKSRAEQKLADTVRSQFLAAYRSRDEHLREQFFLRIQAQLTCP